MSTAFEDAHYEQAYPDGYAGHFWHVARDRLVIDAVRRTTPAGAKCLEIGCGRGHFVTALRAAGFDATGVELGEPQILAEARSFVRTGASFADLEIGLREGVACVLLLDVIEHIGDPSEFLRQVAASFPRLRTLVVTVPARPEIWSNYDDHYGHFRRYSLEGLRDEIQGAGFRVVEVRYAFRALYLAALALRWLGARRGVIHQAPRIAGLHKAVALGLALETRLLPKGVYGSSLLCLGVPERRNP